MRRAGVGTALASALLAAGIAACTFSREISIHAHQLLKPVPGGLVNSVNMEEQLLKGMVPEVLEFLAGPGGRAVDSTRGARTAGRARLRYVPGALVEVVRRCVPTRAEVEAVLAEISAINAELLARRELT